MRTDFQFVSASQGEVIFREDEIGDCAYIIETGRVQISVERNGKYVTVATLGAGEIVGEMAIITRGRRSATAVALEDCKLQRIEARQFQARVETMDPVMRMVIEVILSRFRTTLKGIDEAPPALREIALLPKPHTAEAMKNLRLESEISVAVEAGQFVPFYQPVVDLQSGRLAGFEALTRWVHPTRGIVSPETFIPIAEQSDLITQVTTSCLNNICRDMPELRAACLTNPENVLPVFVGLNITGRDLDRPDFLTGLQAELAKTGLTADMFKLEVTESSIMIDLDRIRTVLERIREAGFAVAIDDFGTGYSSMGYLANLPISTLKIDKSFIMAMSESPQNRKIVTTILKLGEELNLPVIAEGVSTAENTAFLAENGCAFAQGYFYSAPVPLNEALALVRAWPNQAQIATDNLPQAAASA